MILKGGGYCRVAIGIVLLLARYHDLYILYLIRVVYDLQGK